MSTLRDYEQALERDPTLDEPYLALRKAYREGSVWDKLITLYEMRAQALTDPVKASELFYLAAEVRLDHMDDAEGAEADLANAVHRDPSHIRATARLKDLYREQGRTGQYMEMLELEAAAVARSRDPVRIAELQAEMGQLFVNHFARLEKAVKSAPRPSKLTTDHVRSIESARKIYRALGDYRSVVRLYELELEGTTDPKRRADLLLSDLVLGDVTIGPGLARRLLEQKPNLKILYTSGYNPELLPLGADWKQGAGFLPKPFTQEQLLAQVREALATETACVPLLR